MKQTFKTAVAVLSVMIALSACGNGDKGKNGGDSTQTTSAAPADSAAHSDSTRKDTTVVKTDTAFTPDGVDTIKKSVIKTSTVKKTTTKH